MPVYLVKTLRDLLEEVLATWPYQALTSCFFVVDKQIFSVPCFSGCTVPFWQHIYMVVEERNGSLNSSMALSLQGLNKITLF